MLQKKDNIAKHFFYISDATDTFDIMCKKALKKEYIPEIIDIESY